MFLSQRTPGRFGCEEGTHPCLLKGKKRDEEVDEITGRLRDQLQRI
jgi:hypothetical protein